jgi:hypothetical protein
MVLQNKFKRKQELDPIKQTVPYQSGDRLVFLNP